MSPSIADRLDALADDWRDLMGTIAARPGRSPALADQSAALESIAREMDAMDDDRAGAVRRVALLGELWECLASEPGLDAAAAELAEFYLGAVRSLASELRDGNGTSTGTGTGNGTGRERVADWILRQAAERWGDYLGAIDPASEDTSPPDPLDAVDEPAINEDEPPGLAARALLSLLGVGVASDAVRGTRREDESPGPPPPIRAAPVDGRVRAAATDTGIATPVRIPPVPARIDLDDEMREAFLADAIDLFERIERIVVGLRGRDDPRDDLAELARCFHTLKGAAGSVGLKETAALVHDVEEWLGTAGGAIEERVSDLLHGVVGHLDELIRRLRRGDDTGPAAGPGPAMGMGMEPVPGETSVPAPTSEFEGPIRLSPARFDELTDIASELILQGRFWLSQAGSMKSLAGTAQTCRHRLLASLDGLYGLGLGRERTSRRWRIDPGADLPDLLRRLGEQANDLAELTASAQSAAGAMADRGDALVRLSHRLWDSLQSLRIVPIAGMFRRLARVVQEAARVEGRPVEVITIGEDTGVDRAVQDRAFEPLLHAARNAVSHGIEPPADRVRLGKNPAGRVTLEARREGTTLVISVADDGKGLDEEAIAATARRLGWLAPGETPDPARLRSLIFEPGFSTRSEVNDIAGRGVGMDVVAREVRQLRGTVDLDSRRGCGTRLTIRLPARMALEPALVVRIGGQLLAIPASQVEQVRPFEPLDGGPDAPREPGAVEAGSVPHDHAADEPALPVVPGREVLGIGPPESPAWPKLVMVRTSGGPVGLVVDEVAGAEDLVIKPLGPLLAGHPLVAGTSVSIDGDVILVLSASGLDRWVRTRNTVGTSPTDLPAPSPDAVSRTGPMAVLVVDDSISVRRGVARQLHGMGLVVDEAPDGLEALRRLRDASYGLVVTDLEMPRLDGLALLAEMRRSPNLAAIPVVVASTRDDPDTRRRVLELGARALLAKPVDLPELTRIVGPLLAGRAG